MYGKNRKVHKLGRKVGLLTAFLLILTSVAAVALCVRMFYTLTMNLLRDECVNGTNILGYQLSHSSEQVDMTELLDDLKEQLGCEFTVFQGNVRAYTTIIQDGERVVGTELSEDLTEIVLGRGESYVGNADVLGVHHLCSYAPVFDESGQATGLIFAGISLVEAEEQINHTIWLVILVGTAFVIFSLCIMTIFIRRAVSRPLSKLTQMAQTMEQGRLGISESDAYQNLDIDSNDEIGLLADIFTHTIERLRGYIGEISTILQDISKGSLSSETTQDYVGDFVAISYVN